MIFFCFGQLGKQTIMTVTPKSIVLFKNQRGTRLRRVQRRERNPMQKCNKRETNTKHYFSFFPLHVLKEFSPDTGNESNKQVFEPPTKFTFIFA